MVSFLKIFSNIFSDNKTDSKDLLENISINWDQRLLEEDKQDSVHEYIGGVLSTENVEPALAEINQWLSELDETEERWGDVNQSYLELRISRLEQPGSYSDDTFLAIDLNSPYVVQERNTLDESDCYLIDVSVEGTSYGLPKAEKIASVDYNSL